MAEPAQSANAPTKDAPVTPPPTPGEVPKKLPKGVVLGKDGKPCRSCTSVSDWFAMAASETSNSPGTKGKTTKIPTTLPDDCPPDVEALGRASWTLLHTMTAAYPEKPTLAEQSSAISFVKSCGWGVGRSLADGCARRITIALHDTRAPAKQRLYPVSSPTVQMSSSPTNPSLSRASTLGSTTDDIDTTVTTSSSGYLPSIGKLLRRLSGPYYGSTPSTPASPSLENSQTLEEEPDSDMHGSIYTPPLRTASPFQPPPLYPLTLCGYSENTDESARLMSKAIAEEIRLLIPPRLQLCDEWNLVYSLEQDGVSLGTMYKNCDELRGLRNGYVLVVKDGDGGLFGAYLTEAPHISPHYFGTGECFLWRASVFSQVDLSQLPLPPSADTTNMQRSTSLNLTPSSPLPRSPNTLAPPTAPPTRPTSPSQVRFKAFPYSGINDYFMLCDATFFSIGGGDGNYGLWLDDSFDRGISSTCLTFGNEPLSDQGKKFDILGVELWAVGSLR
ncbi:hypothetical protein O988_08892 [Pseudogymnoascus sp. VKM F-3808]|nr:hypothetical protein O988_08892 [Pseudogymnoascus sp. VKM F-3808]